MREKEKSAGVLSSFLWGMLLVPFGVSLVAFVCALCIDLLTYVGGKKADEPLSLTWGVMVLGGIVRLACCVIIIEVLF